MITKIVEEKIQRRFFNMIKYVSAYTSSEDGLEEVEKKHCAQLMTLLFKSGIKKEKIKIKEIDI